MGIIVSCTIRTEPRARIIHGQIWQFQPKDVAPCRQDLGREVWAEFQGGLPWHGRRHDRGQGVSEFPRGWKAREATEGVPGP